MIQPLTAGSSRDSEMKVEEKPIQPLRKRTVWSQETRQYCNNSKQKQSDEHFFSFLHCQSCFQRGTVVQNFMVCTHFYNIRLGRVSPSVFADFNILAFYLKKENRWRATLYSLLAFLDVVEGERLDVPNTNTSVSFEQSIDFFSSIILITSIKILEMSLCPAPLLNVLLSSQTWKYLELVFSWSWTGWSQDFW